ncbi:MAG: Serine/threonine-protein kinase [Anaerolineales bacterium]|nr:Serine/threonine-protein kinase [Anaerolineales bacterium]
MEYVEGPTLKAELHERATKGRGFSPEETARLFTPLAHAIDYAHAQCDKIFRRRQRVQ